MVGGTITVIVMLKKPFLISTTVFGRCFGNGHFDDTTIKERNGYDINTFQLSTEEIGYLVPKLD